KLKDPPYDTTVCIHQTYAHSLSRSLFISLSLVRSFSASLFHAPSLSHTHTHTRPHTCSHTNNDDEKMHHCRFVCVCVCFPSSRFTIINPSRHNTRYTPLSHGTNKHRSTLPS